ncbi:MAG TPA: hypothetical protein VFQ65_15275 [Kofleriaceae bacterium]|nr:hypothetical protein [Kofleriaceae bacterium]
MDQGLAETEQAIDSGARDRFFSLNTAGNAWSRVQSAPLSSTFEPFEALDGNGIVKLAAERNADGRISLFAIGGDGVLYGRYQTSPGGGWNPDGWGSLSGGYIVQVITARNADGRIELFVRNQWGNVFHRFQTAPNAGWNPEGWLPFGGTGLVSIAAATRADGRLEVVGIGGDGHMYHRVQFVPNSGWDADWSIVGGAGLQSVLLVPGATGGLNAIALDSNTGANVEEAHATAAGVWSGFSAIGHMHMAKIAVGTMPNGDLDILGLLSASASLAYQLPQIPITHLWTGTFARMSWPQQLEQLAPASNANGDLVVFARGTDGVVYDAMQDPRSTVWSSLGSLGGAWQADLVAIDQQ